MRLSDAGMERQRVNAAHEKWDDAMKCKDRWYLRKESTYVATEEVHDRVKDRLDAFWQGCISHFDEQVFLKR